jgi:hypothetical protein
MCKDGVTVEHSAYFYERTQNTIPAEAGLANRISDETVSWLLTRHLIAVRFLVSLIGFGPYFQPAQKC